MSNGLLDISCENVYIYIGDAVRWDRAPDDLLHAGLAHKGLAASIHSPTSIASIISGVHLPQHGVVDFTDQLSDQLPSLLELPIDTAFINTINDVRFDPTESESIIAKTLRTSVSSASALEEMESPFFVLERGPGGHAPYVRDEGINDGTDYFRKRGDTDRSTYAAEYDQAVREDVDWFFSRVNQLDESGFLDDTLIIYLSDHGELLGEDGMLAHAPPIHPKHVYVPFVFIHPDLEPRTYRERLVRHVDVAPTVRSLFDCQTDDNMTSLGNDLTSSEPVRAGTTFFTREKSTRFGDLTAHFESAWDPHGGYVWPRSGRAVQLLLAAHQQIRVPWHRYARANFTSHIQFLLRGARTHGSPVLTAEKAEKLIADIRAVAPVSESETSIDVPVDRLKELGYME